MKYLSVSLQLSFAAQCGYVRTYIFACEVNVNKSAPSRGQRLQKTFHIGTNICYLWLIGALILITHLLRKKVVETRNLSSWGLNIAGASSQVAAWHCISHTCMCNLPFVCVYAYVSAFAVVPYPTLTHPIFSGTFTPCWICFQLRESIKANVLRWWPQEWCFDSSTSSQNWLGLSHHGWLSASVFALLSLHTKALTATDNKSKKKRREMRMLSNMSSNYHNRWP